MATIGSAVLQRAAARVSQEVLRDEVRQITGHIARNLRQLHHNNPLKGHPGRALKTLFPTAGLPAAIHSAGWNTELLDKAAHILAHRQLRGLENAVRPLFNGWILAARGARNLLTEQECH